MAKFILSLVFVLLLFVVSAQPSHAATDCDRASRLAEEARRDIESNPAQAEQKLREAVAYCGKSASLHYNLGVARYQRGQNNDAETQFEEALKIKPDYAKAMNSLAAILYQKKDCDYSRTLKLATKAVELDPKNRQFRETLDMITSEVDTPPTTTISNPFAVAVVIGNKSYKSSAVPVVEYANRDADVVKSYLVETLGFKENNIIFIHDGSYTDFLRIFGDTNDHRGSLYNRVRAGVSDVFIFYAGHGAPDTNNKKAFIAPVDVDPFAIKLTSYSLDLLYENLAKLSQEKRPKTLTIVIDACFSGASQSGMIVKDASPITLEISTPVLKLKDAVVFTSSSAGQISSWYPEQKHSLFTYFFLKTIKTTVASGKPLISGDIEKSLVGPESVNDYALRLYNREQNPQIVGSKNIVLWQ